MKFKSFKELKEEIDTYGEIISIKNEEGIYRIIIPDDFIINIMDHTDGRFDYKDDKPNNPSNKNVYLPEKLIEKRDTILKINPLEKIVYIGKADKGKNKDRGLKTRIFEYMLWGYNVKREKGFFVHSGGKAIWQIENNKDLIVTYEYISNPRLVERNELIEFKKKYGEYPLANWRM